MCGICGYISKNIISYEILKAMTDTMIQRGPDGYGIWQDEIIGEYVGLGHRRLSIIDLTDNGKQPMVSEDGQLAVSYNGELYNFMELRRELEKEGFLFSSKCDTEVILKAYAAWGVDSFKKFNGMFAFAVADKRNKKVILCRDRLGVKPVYYAKTKDGICFSSDLASIMKYPAFEGKIDSDALHYYLWNMFIPAPHTIFCDTYKLNPGEYLEYDFEKKDYKIDSWWHPFELYKNGLITLGKDEWLQLIEETLADSVKIRMVADVPVGLFLSGGIDSSLVAAMACESSNDVKTFSIGFHEKEYDEGQYAKDIADYLGTDHHSLYCSINDARELIRDIPKAYNEPFADNSQIPMLLLSKLTSEQVTVALSGDGGDELFGGYPHVLNLNQIYNKKLLLSDFGKTMYLVTKGNNDLYGYSTWKYKKAAYAKNAEFIRNLDYYTAFDLVNSILIRSYRIEDTSDCVVKELETDLPDTDFKNQLLLRDLRIGLPDDMLTKVDRATMRYSLEARCPLLDYRLAEYAVRMPLDIKYCDGKLKYVLKTILEKKIPGELINRPKQGFGIPINKWLRDEKFMLGFKAFFDESFIKEQGVFDPEGINKLLKEFETAPTPILDRIVWTYVNFQMWWEEYYKCA